MSARKLSNDELLSSLSATWREEGALIARVIAMLIEVEERRLHLELAYSSMRDFCMRKLGMSDGEAYRRLGAAAIARQYPQALDAIGERRIHMSNLLLVANLITPSNIDELLCAIAGKTKREVELLIARMAPKPDVLDSMRRLPERRLASASPPPIFSRPAASPRPNIPMSAQIAPLSETRHKIQFTASSGLREMLERGQDMMRHRNANGDLATVIERAMVLLITQLEKERLGATSRKGTIEQPSKPARKPTRGKSAIPVSEARSESAIATITATPLPETAPRDTRTKTGAIPRATRRAVFARDGQQCSFVSAGGDRCPATQMLELDHRTPRAKGGDGTPDNIRVLCRRHNQHAAEKSFGRAHIEIQIRARSTAPRSPTKGSPTMAAPTSTTSSSAAARTLPLF